MPTTELVLNTDGCAVCPECKIHIHCGNVGLSNLTIRHMGSKTKWKIIPQQAETDALNECLCRLVVKQSSEGALLCKKKGMRDSMGVWLLDTIFNFTYLNILYHLQCVSLEQAPRSWVCMTCSEPAQGRGGKRLRGWCHITIFRLVPDYVVS